MPLGRYDVWVAIVLNPRNQIEKNGMSKETKKRLAEAVDVGAIIDAQTGFSLVMAGALIRRQSVRSMSGTGYPLTSR